jgi:hypothetical protein
MHQEGVLPREIGNLTELNSLLIYNDHSSGSIPESISLCTKLKFVLFRDAKLQGVFPAGLRALKSLGIHAADLT